MKGKSNERILGTEKNNVPTGCPIRDREHPNKAVFVDVKIGSCFNFSKSDGADLDNAETSGNWSVVTNWNVWMEDDHTKTGISPDPCTSACIERIREGDT